MTPVTDEIARGEKVRLRRKRLADAAVDFAWRRDPELARFDAAAPLRSSYNEYLVSYREDLDFPSPFRRVFAIESLEGEHIGNVMYYNIDERRHEAELGVTIGDKRYWSQGYGRDAVRTFLRYLFTVARMDRVYLNTLDWNVRAQHAFRAAGFEPCGINRRGLFTFMTMEVMRDAWLSGEPAQGDEDAT